MAFNSLAFLIFFPTVCLLATLISPICCKTANAAKLLRLRHIMLLIASYVFYGWWNWKFCFLMLLLTAVAYFCAEAHDKNGKKWPIYVGVIFPLFVLGLFKYYNFFVESFCDAFGIMQAGTLNIILPVGISFYTFQSLSYTIDVYRGKIKTDHDFVRLALYIAFFPQLVAGPIVKAGDFLPQLYEDRQISMRNIELGVQYFAFGLFKKIVLADNISVFVDAVFRAPEAYSAVTILLSAFAYSIQIYCDFSGYSDMAVGCAKVLGYDLTRNFNIPFIARNISDLWKRWHISLSTWLMEYLYIPLGGSRRGTARAYLNLFLTMVLGGLWHGANWTFVLWGALNGMALGLHKYLTRNKPKNAAPSRNPIFAFLSILTTFTFFALTAMIFRADTISKALSMLWSIFTLADGLTHISFWAVVGLVLIFGGSIIAIIKSRREGMVAQGFYPTVPLDKVWGLAVFFTFVGLTLALAYTGESPFIYFQF